MNTTKKIADEANPDVVLNQKPTTNNKILPKDFFLLDVRTPEEFARGHIPNSTLIPIDEISQNLERIKQIKQPILIICRSDSRASYVQEYLEENGITNSKILEGGILQNSHLLN